MKSATIPTGFGQMLSYGLVDALLGRSSRRFFLGAGIPDGVFAYQSRHEPVPLSELEKPLLVTACVGNTSWHHMLQNGVVLYGDINKQAIPIQQFNRLVDVENLWPLTFLDQMSLAELTTELATSCYPGTVPSVFAIMYLQAHHLDLEFYDKFYKPGSYLKTHAMHMT